MPIGPGKTRLQSIVDTPLAEAVELAASRCGLSVSELIAVLIRDGTPATIIGIGDRGELRRVVAVREVVSPKRKGS